jgi:hypothetical protein
LSRRGTGEGTEDQKFKIQDSKFKIQNSKLKIKDSTITIKVNNLKSKITTQTGINIQYLILSFEFLQDS